MTRKIVTFEIPVSTIISGVAAGIILAGLIGVAVTYQVGLLASFTWPVKANQDKAAVEAMVIKSYKNEHFSPNADGTCWFPRSPAQWYVLDHLTELKKMIPIAEKHLNKEPVFKQVSLSNRGYAEVVETERWFFPKIGSARSLDRTYNLKKTDQGWQVYQITPLPTESMLPK